MTANFSPSINILRDADKPFDYIPTPNNKRVFQQIVNDYRIGIHAFNIIGSFGTGKSAFLLALQQNLSQIRNDFGEFNGQFGGITEFEFLTLVGEYASIINAFAARLDIPQEDTNPSQVFKALEQHYHQQKKRCLVILVDELGKFLEYATHHNTSREVYFIQQLAEYANDADKSILFITTLHQGFDSYARNLDYTERQEWEKVKGRLQELTFNEPVELLLQIAASHLQGNFAGSAPPENLSDLVTAVNHSRTFPHRNQLTLPLARSLLPLDALSGAVLTLALQQYGQNERSLFTFLKANDYFGLNHYDTNQNPYYNLACIYDYLLHNYHSFLSTKYNPHYLQWSAIRRALERIEGVFEEDIPAASKLAKAIGLLNIFTTADAKIDVAFLVTYGRDSLGLDDPQHIIQSLEDRKVIRYVAFRHRFILFEGTDLDIELALLNAASNVDSPQNFVLPLTSYFDFPYILAKAATYKWGTPRFFEFKLSEIPLQSVPQGEVDGFINLIFSETLTVEEIKAASGNCEEAILYGWYRNTHHIRNILFEIEKINYVIGVVNQEDKVAKEELQSLRAYQIEELNRNVLDSIYQGADDLLWFFQGHQIKLKGIDRFNSFLSEMCEKTYPKTPIFRNELINRHKLPGTVSAAKNRLLEALVKNWRQENLGFAQKTFPAEKTIYLTLLKETGIHHLTTDDTYELKPPEADSFIPLWEAGEHFLQEAKVARKSLQALIDVLLNKPFKLKQGFIDIWLPVFLFINRAHIAIFEENIYIPELNSDMFELIYKYPARFFVKTFDIAGVKLDFFNGYRRLLEQQQAPQFSSETFVETINPFFTFYRSLPNYTHKTKRLNKRTLKLREAIAKAKDPEKTFFEDFPKALDYKDLNFTQLDDEGLASYTFQLQESIKELQNCFADLVTRIEQHFLQELGYEAKVFPDYKVDIATRYQTLKKHLLLPQQKVFFTRLLSPLEERQTWLSSVVQAVLKKNIAHMRDEDEEVVFDRLSQAIRELDNLCKITAADIDLEQEEVVQLEITTFNSEPKKETIRLPKQKSDEAAKLQAAIREVLVRTTDITVQKVALLKLLQDLLDYEDS
ncbi:MAG: hypothetical protein GY797_11095 [Deltaproteobacteria bacterium]|nr:hypothetical protein [Deltaproteobacteria bacterium]